MRYAELRREDLDIGTSAVEGAVRNLVGMRLDGPGMRWGRDRAELDLHLRCILLNGQWDALADYLKKKPVKLAPQPALARTHDAKSQQLREAARLRSRICTQLGSTCSSNPDVADRPRRSHPAFPDGPCVTPASAKHDTGNLVADDLRALHRAARVISNHPDRYPPNRAARITSRFSNGRARRAIATPTPSTSSNPLEKHRAPRSRLRRERFIELMIV